MTNLLPANWLGGHDYTPDQDRETIAALRSAPGVVGWNDFAVSASLTPDWNITVGPGRAVIDGSVSPWTQGSYVVYSGQNIVVPVTPSDPSQDRYDVVILHVYDAENSNVSGYGWAPEVVQGTPGVAGPPTLPSNCLPIASLLVGAGSTAVSSSSFQPRFWPRQGGLQKASGGRLLDYAYRRTSSAIGAAGTNPSPFMWYDPLIPQAWVPIASWSFEVVMTIDINVWATATANGSLVVRLYPRNGRLGPPNYPNASPAPATNPNFFFDRQISTVATPGYGPFATSISISETQLFQVGEVPQWSLDVWSPWTTYTVWIDTHTIIEPRGPNTMRGTGGTGQTAMDFGPGVQS